MKRAVSRETGVYLLLSLLGAIWAVYFYNAVPSYTDAYYHMNGAISLATGEGFTDHVIWTFIAAPDDMPAPSHLYWMPGTSIISALGMKLFGTSYAAAQVGLVACLWGAMWLAYGLAVQLGGSVRHRWLAGLLTLFSGFFTGVWGQTDTFAPYAFFGAAALISMSMAIRHRHHQGRYWLLAGALAACGHLIRSDGLILVLVGYCVLLYPFDLSRHWRRIGYLLPFTLAYLLVMSPWFVRNLNEIGTILPTGGTQNTWFTEYDELFNYPPQASPATLFAEGWDIAIQSRATALFSNNSISLQAIVYQGAIVFFPFILFGLWHNRHEPFIRPFWIFALGIHVAFSLVFTYAGLRGGFWHGVAALVPIWAVIGLFGLDAAVVKIAQYRRHWRPHSAQYLLSIGLVMIVVLLTLQINYRKLADDNRLAQVVAASIPADARIMLNDPSKFYYYTGIMGVTIPNETPSVALEIARRYHLDYLLLVDGGITDPMQFEHVPDFLIPIDLNIDGAALYAFDRD